ncbi:MAG: helix-hairpin-helix domain-containing protein [Saprospiraceae bacterium]
MKSNKEIAAVFGLLAKLMEMWDENPFKFRSYQNAYMLIRKWPEDFGQMSKEKLDAIPGIGKAIAEKVQEINESGTLKLLQTFLDKTPAGVVEMLGIKGFGPKKVLTVWKDMGIESVGELLYACNENRLVQYKGFGAKTQAELIKNLEYYTQSQGQFLYATAERPVAEILEYLSTTFPKAMVSEAGALRRKMPVLDRLEFVIGEVDIKERIQALENLVLDEVNLPEGGISGVYREIFPVKIYAASPDQFGNILFQKTGSEEYVQFINSKLNLNKAFATEMELFASIEMPFWAPEMREELHAANFGNEMAVLIEDKDIKGVVHNHSKYSDGVNTLEEMAIACQTLGYEYLVISDHSQSAFYANGMQEEHVIMQWREIEVLNAKMAPFKIYKSIESDILNDGSLDYPEDLLKGFDLVIASVHSNLKMDEERATSRLLKAIENPYTTILGHPTGRLLLSRPGYPIDHKRIIDACAAHKVAIEINANPQRLDIEYQWLPYAIEQGVKICINPDAHSVRGIHDIKYGVLVARKGGLTAGQCVNTMGREEFEGWLASSKA